MEVDAERPLIDSPGPISGLSKDVGVSSRKGQGEIESILTTDGHRFVDIPTILELVCTVSTRREK